MIDPYADLRASIEGAIRDAVKVIDDAYRSRIERCQERGWSRDLARLMTCRANDVERATKPLVSQYAKLPGPPIVIKIADLSPEARERFGL